MFDDFDEAVFSELFSEKKLMNKLARWNETPALFRVNFPSDSDDGWEGKQYPRIVFYTQYNYEPEQRIAGKLIIHAHTTIDEQVQPEELEEQIKKTLSVVLFNTKKGVFCLSWNSSEPFLIQEDSSPLVKGIRVEFDIIAFPDQRTYLYPDPVVGIEDFLHNIDPKMLLINRDELPDAIKPREPIGYVRTLSVSNLGRDSYFYRNERFVGSIHVISTSIKRARQTLGRLYQEIIDKGRMTLENGGQFLFTDNGNNTSVSYMNDALIDGQISVEGEFRLLANHDKKQYKNFYIQGEFEDGKTEPIKIK